MKCPYCGNTDVNTIQKLEGYYHYRCKGGFEFDEFPDDYFEVEK